LCVFIIINKQYTYIKKFRGAYNPLTPSGYAIGWKRSIVQVLVFLWPFSNKIFNLKRFGAGNTNERCVLRATNTVRRLVSSFPVLIVWDIFDAIIIVTYSCTITMHIKIIIIVLNYTDIWSIIKHIVIINTGYF
jgi:hypothetical protein